jgi:hypothetical protein
MTTALSLPVTGTNWVPTGTEIMLYGQLPNTDDVLSSTTTQAYVSIDDSLIAANISILPNPIGGQVSNNLLYRSPLGGLRPGNHTISVSVPEGAPFALDYILITPNPVSNSSGNSPPLVSNGISSSMSSSEFTSTSSSSSTRNVRIGVTVGGALGGICAVIILISLVLLYFRRRRRNTNETGSEAGIVERKSLYQLSDRSDDGSCL